MNTITTASEAWLELIGDVRGLGDNVSPAGKRTSEILAYTSAFDMRYPLVAVKPRKLSYKYAFGESWWILSGRDDVASIAPYNSRISRYSDDGVVFYGAYGPRVVAQMPGVVHALVEDSDSRRAIMSIWRENPPQTKDYPCTVNLQWFIRGGKLHCVDTMRSSDSWLGWPYDVFTFSMVSAAIALELRAWNVHVELGTFRLNAASQHLYETDWAKVDAVLASEELIDFNYRPFDPHFFPSAGLFVEWLKFIADGKGAEPGPFEEVYEKIK